jgi:hypothetical protein
VEVNQIGFKNEIPIMSLAEKLVTPEYYTATIDHSSIAGFEQAVRSSSLRQCMRFAARFNADHPSEAEINVYQHVDGHDPKLVAKRRVTDRFWKYITNN